MAAKSPVVGSCETSIAETGLLLWKGLAPVVNRDAGRSATAKSLLQQKV